jgi:low affinity Fe/Cu permease
MSTAETFTEVADHTARASGRPIVFGVVAASTTVWLLRGPVFAFLDWQLIANTTTSVITFLMVFVIQNSQTGMQPLFKRISMSLFAQRRAINHSLVWKSALKRKSSASRRKEIDLHDGYWRFATTCKTSNSDVLTPLRFEVTWNSLGRHLATWAAPWKDSQRAAQAHRSL